MKLSAKSADGVRPLGSAAGRRAVGEMAEDGSPETEEERLYRPYKEQAEGVGPDLMKTLLDSLALRGEALGKLEIELQSTLLSLKTDEHVMTQILKQRFGKGDGGG